MSNLLNAKRIFSAFVSLFVIQLFILSQASAGLIGTQQEIEMGKEVARQIEEKYPLLDDAEVQARIERIGKNIVAVCDRPDLPYTFKVLDVDEVNAMAAPGGFIYVYSGLIKLMPTDDELAGIIGHEIGHVVKRHSMGQLEKNLGISLIFGGIFGDKGKPLQSIALSAISAGYSRSDERQADLLGYQQSVKAGYNQYGMLMGLTKLYELNPKQRNDLFSDHPEASARIELMKQYLAEAHVTPTVKQIDANAAQVVDGDWSLPAIHTGVGATGPLYRAYLVAGRLYDIKNLENYSKDKYEIREMGRDLAIYYDDRNVVTVTSEDAAFYEVSVRTLADRYMESLRNWSI